MARIVAAIVSLLSIVAVAASAGAAVRPGAALPPAVLSDVIGCSALADDHARLQCFDAAVAKLATANSQGDIAVFDKEQVTKTKRALFGLNLPTLDIFARRSGNPVRDQQESELKEITAQVTQIGHAAEGGLMVMLDDGARWIQVDDAALGRQPKAGMTATIRRGVLGSFSMNFDHGPWIKVRRVN